MHSGFGAHPSFHGGGFREGGFSGRNFHGFRNHCFGCRGRFGYPWYPGYGYAGYYDPYWWSDSFSYDYDEDQARQIALANEMDRFNLEEQRLREREDWDQERDQDLYARRGRQREEERTVAGPATVLVFRDQHQQEVQNYAIAGQTLWVFSEQTAKKIPLADLDLTATAKVNDDRGVDFRVPK